MNEQNKINLAVIFYGDKKQIAVNNQQIMGLKKLLTSFNVLRYDFHNGKNSKLLYDFRDGKIDMVLKNSYGRGHEKNVEDFLEKHKIPFMGSGPKATFMGTSKFLAKRIFIKHKIPVVKDIYVNKLRWQKSKYKIIDKIAKDIDYPCVVKDTGGTDSRGLYLAKNKNHCIKYIEKLINNGRDLIIEEYINKASEVTCLVVGNKKPIAYEPVSMGNNIGLFSGHKKDNISYQMKIPAALPQVIIDQIKKVSRQAHQALDCQTFSRADILVKNRRLFLLEVDVHPGFRAKSPTFLSAKYQNEFPDELFLKFYNLVKSK